MQGAGNQFFAGTTIAENQHCGLTRPNHFDKRAQFFDGYALADNILRTGQKLRLM